ncbi:hypothetical protein BDR07DRAFT_1392726 [Suillus spraguei]|nr:hypothetical protein BDR07DRAFT_1392726 [Suillus spraguei]
MSLPPSSGTPSPDHNPDPLHFCPPYRGSANFQYPVWPVTLFKSRSDQVKALFGDPRKPPVLSNRYL